MSDPRLQHKAIRAGILIISFVGLVFLAYTLYGNASYEPPVLLEVGGQRIERIPYGVDWVWVIRNACLRVLAGSSPYVSAFYNPPWILLPLLPIALLPASLGGAVVAVLNLYAFIYVALKLRMNWLLLAPFVLFTGPLLNAKVANIDGLVALGLVLPKPLGLFFLLAKPQASIAVVLYWGVGAWKERRLAGLAQLLGPVAIAFAVSLIIYGNWVSWVLTWSSSLGLGSKINTSIWPYGIPIGLLLLLRALKAGDFRWSIAASPFLAPYVNLHVWAFTALGLLALIPLRVPFPHVLRTPRKSPSGADPY